MPDRRIPYPIEPARYAAAIGAYNHAMRRGQTWRHAVRDALAAADAAQDGTAWTCPVCGAGHAPEAERPRSGPLDAPVEASVAASVPAPRQRP